MSVEVSSTTAPAAAAPRMSACISAFAPTSTPRVGSSSSRTDGCASSHFANTTFCWLPPDSCRRARRPSACGPAGARRARAPARAGAARGRPAPRAASATARTWPMFSHSGLSSISPKRRRSPETSATPAPIAPRRPRGTGRPPGSRTLPRSARRWPLTSSRTVVCPAPAIPARPTISPGRRRQADVVERARGPTRPRAAAARRRRGGRTSSISVTCSASSRACLVGGRDRAAPPLAQHRVDDRGRGQLGARDALEDRAAVAQHGDLVAEREHLLEDVRDEHDARPAARAGRAARSSSVSVLARSSAEVGSSRMSTRGCVTSALATSTSWRSRERQRPERRAQRHVEAELGQHGPRPPRHLGARDERAARAARASGRGC